MWSPSSSAASAISPASSPRSPCSGRAFRVEWMFISLILFSIYFPVRSRTDMRHPWIKWLIIVPQIPMVPVHFAVVLRPALPQPLHPALSCRRRSTRSCGKRLRFHLPLHLHRRNRRQALCRSGPRSGCTAPPGRGCRRLGARPGTATRAAGDSPPSQPNRSWSRRLPGPSSPSLSCSPFFLSRWPTP